MDFKINEFEGPLDLLLHLIKESKMNIMDIEIEKITDQYMNYLDLQEKMNLEIASEYLVMASELIELKSKLLLPNPKNEEGEEEDPREELVNRLLEYQAYKEIQTAMGNIFGQDDYEMNYVEQFTVFYQFIYDLNPRQLVILKDFFETFKNNNYQEKYLQ